MPFTPLHMGPALFIKPFTGPRFSLMAYGLAQIAMDIEPLIQMIRADERHHRFTHNFLAALAIGVLVAVLMRQPSEKLLRLYSRLLAHFRLGWLGEGTSISFRTMLMSALVGTLGHVMLDGLIHGDMQPFAPFMAGNPLLLQNGAAGWVAVHLFCKATGLVGAAGYVFLRLRRAR